MKGAYLALKIYCEHYQKGTSVHFKIGNTDTFVWINKQTVPD